MHHFKGCLTATHTRIVPILKERRALWFVLDSFPFPWGIDVAELLWGHYCSRFLFLICATVIARR